MPWDKEKNQLIVEIGEEKKALTEEQISELVKRSDGLVQKEQLTAAAIKAADKYGISVDEYITQAEGSFGIVSDLMEQGLIDQNGQIVKQPANPEGNPEPPRQPATPAPRQQSSELDDVIKSLTSTVKGLEQKLDKLGSTQSNIGKVVAQSQLRTRFPNLGDADVEEIFQRVGKDRSKDIWKHAEEVAQLRANSEREREMAFAKKYGINIEEFDNNKLIEQNPGKAGEILLKGKKVSFRKGEDSVTPEEATRQFFNRRF